MGYLLSWRDFVDAELEVSAVCWEPSANAKGIMPEEFLGDDTGKLLNLCAIHSIMSDDYSNWKCPVFQVSNLWKMRRPGEKHVIETLERLHKEYRMGLLKERYSAFCRRQEIVRLNDGIAIIAKKHGLQISYLGHFSGEYVVKACRNGCYEEIGRISII